MSDVATKQDVNELRAQVNERFEQVDQRFEQVDQRFEQVDQRFEQIDRRFEQVDHRFDKLEGRMDAMESRLSWEIGHAINAGMEHVATLIRALDDKYSAMPEQIRQLWRAIDDLRMERNER